MSDDGFDAVCDKWIAEAQAERRREDSAEYRESLALIKAVRLAPTPEVAEMLLLGQAVPASALNPIWRRAYGL